MKAPQLIKKTLLEDEIKCFEEYGHDWDNSERLGKVLNELTDDNIDYVYGEVCELDGDFRYGYYYSEFRQNYDQVIESHEYSGRHYDGDFVAQKIGDIWVGYPYYYGGGKYGSPELIDWIDDAVYLKATETTKVVYEFEVIK